MNGGKEEQLAHASEYFEIPSENEIKMMIAKVVKIGPRKSLCSLSSSLGYLFQLLPKSFYIGDNPLAMNNSVKQTFYEI